MYPEVDSTNSSNIIELFNALIMVSAGYLLLFAAQFKSSMRVEKELIITATQQKMAKQSRWLHDSR